MILVVHAERLGITVEGWAGSGVGPISKEVLLKVEYGVTLNCFFFASDTKQMQLFLESSQLRFWI